MGSQAAHSSMDFKDIPVPKNYKSPLQRRDERPNDANYRVLATSDDKTTLLTICIMTTLGDLRLLLVRVAFKEFVAEKPTTTENVQIFARFIWSSAHTVKDGRRLLRLHRMTLLLMSLRKRSCNYEHNQYGVDQDLITATIFDAENNTEGLPAAGQKVKFTRFWSPKLYREICCQLTTKIENLVFHGNDTNASSTTNDHTDLPGQSENDSDVVKVETTPSSPVAPRKKFRREIYEIGLHEWYA
ncbi:hypothetical protein GN244_ATG02514 [Phytophthora infestans]|uniref:Uncharacterized protein n=1 Tax=Phytophthora infestans TaxID=4787 RepID=A0A833TKW9_PHYIN|nr:hypothetical protein GN244_ATG02514 [Phytophthora infestans]KAF4149936.1 hypothetical protein GN958_ATG00875 [Phytophthora infestans]